MERYLLVAAFGALGAVSRYAVDGWVSDATRGQFPWGTLVITQGLVTVEPIQIIAYRAGEANDDPPS